LNSLANAYTLAAQHFEKSKKLDFIVLLALRLYLAPVFISAGYNKLGSFDSTVAWFGNPDWGLGLPFPFLMAFLAISAELLGGILLLLGLMTRLVSIPLLVTMLVAPSSQETSMAKVLNIASIPGSEASLDNSAEVGKRLSIAKDILKEHGNYQWLTEKGGFVILNNGIEFAATYLIMLLVLFFYGPGRFVSVDYWVDRTLKRSLTSAP